MLIKYAIVGGGGEISVLSEGERVKNIMMKLKKAIFSVWEKESTICHERLIVLDYACQYKIRIVLKGERGDFEY